jgi:hypothetical protein
MKAFEVKLAVTGGHKGQTRTVFVEANTKSEVENCEGVIQVWPRPDMKSEECPMQIISDVIAEKDVK